MTPALTPAQQTVARRVLAEEGARRRHLVVALSGAHAYGFPSPDSDLDLKAVHLASAEALLGFPRSTAAPDRLEVVDGVEVDYSSNELGPVLLGVLKGNGNYVERFLGALLLEEDPALAELKPLVRGTLSRRLHRHYAGFATQQRLEWERGDRRSAKKLLYVLRTALTGTHVLASGALVTDVTALLDEHGLADARELVEQKRRGERSELPPAMAEAWARRLPAVFAALDAARERSPLPEEPANADALEAWLVELRLKSLR